MSQQPMTNPERKQKQKRALPLLLVVLALGLRLLYVPVHLAQEEHLGGGGHPLSHASADGVHADDGHDHDDDHPPHPASDHESELTVQRTPSQQTSVELPAMPPGENWSLPVPRELPSTAGPEPEPPRQRPRIPQRSRGPPAAA